MEELKPIWQTIKEIKGADLPNIPVMLAGNKCDESPEIREVSAAEGQAQAQTWGVSFMETSAKTNHNVTQLFQVIHIGFYYSNLILVYQCLIFLTCGLKVIYYN